MQHRRVDPRTLTANPNNPRRTAANPIYDQQLTASIRETGGPLQPPVVRAHEDGSLSIIAGHRRVQCSIAAELAEIDVFVREADASGDSMAAFAENVIRTGMCSVDIWRAVEAFIGEGYTEAGIGTALSLPVRTIRRLRLFSKLLPAMLERIAQGDEPNESQLRMIASATREEQAAAWKKHKPGKKEQASWPMISHALRKTRLSASIAVFDEAYATAHGVVWTEDLFVEGDKDPRYTDRIEAFIAAQVAWVTDHLPPNGEMLELGQYGDPRLPGKAERVYGSEKKRKDVNIGFHIDRQTGEVCEVPFIYPQPVKRSGSADTDSHTGQGAKAVRADISGKGQELIGKYRTAALQQALAEGEIDDGQLIGLLVLALAGNNVSVQQEQGYRTSVRDRGRHARAISEGGVVTGDRAVLRTAARGMLADILSCKVGAEDSGPVARIAGTTVHAEVYLPNMATEDFLPRLSKDGITTAIATVGLQPCSTGKLMRTAMLQRIGTGSWVHPAALFELTPAELAELDQRRAADAVPGGGVPEPVSIDDVADDVSDDEPGDDADADQDLILLPPPTDLAEQRLAA